LCGFIEGLQKHDAALADALLDEAVSDPTLAEWFPSLQSCATMHRKALERIQRALDLGKAAIGRFRGLGHGRASDRVPGPDFKRLVLAIGQKPDGVPIGLDILSMRLHGYAADKQTPGPEIGEAGRVLLSDYRFERSDQQGDRDDYVLGRVVRASLCGDEGKPIAQQLCLGLMAAAAKYEVHAFQYDDLMGSLLKVHPVSILDALFSGDRKSRERSVRLLKEFVRFGKNPMSTVADASILRWCDGDPSTRCSIAAAIAVLFTRANEKEPHQWTNLARQLLLKSPDPAAVLKEIASSLIPTSSNGSMATKLETRLRLLEQLDVTGLASLDAVFAATKADLRARIAEERHRETAEGRARSERFE
jgi:hypothetical protein